MRNPAVTLELGSKVSFESREAPSGDNHTKASGPPTAPDLVALMLTSEITAHSLPPQSYITPNASRKVRSKTQIRVLPTSRIGAFNSTDDRSHGTGAADITPVTSTCTGKDPVREPVPTCQLPITASPGVKSARSIVFACIGASASSPPSVIVAVTDFNLYISRRTPAKPGHETTTRTSMLESV